MPKRALIVGYGSIGARHARLLTELGYRTAVVSKREVDLPLGYINSLHNHPIALKLMNSRLLGVRIDIPSWLKKCIATANELTIFPMHECWFDSERMGNFKCAQVEIGGVIR